MGKVSFILSQGQKSLKPGSYIGFCAVLNAIQTKDNEANLNIYCLNCRNATYEPGLRKLKKTVSLDRSLSPILGDKLLVWMNELTGQLYGEMGNYYCV